VARPPLWSIVLSFVLVSCGSGVRYADTLPLSDLVFRVGPGRLTGLVPAGWATARQAEGGEASGSLVLMRGDSLRIVVRALTLDSTAAAYFAERGPGDLARLNRTLRDTSSAGRIGGISRFSINARDYAAYELHDGDGRSRVAVFRWGDSWFECEAAALRKLSGNKSYDELFGFQQTLLGSLH
jgi:hypothetical protein